MWAIRVNQVLTWHIQTQGHTGEEIADLLIQIE